jgi:hypothetical protein
LLTQLLYGVPVDFTRTFRDDDPDLAGILEEPADVFAHGLHVQQVSFLPKDLARDLQRLSEERLLSLTRLRTVLFAATQEDLEVARTRRDLIAQLFEVADLIGYGGRLWHLMLRMVIKPWMQALLSVWLLVLEQSGYGPNIETINEALRTNLPLIRHAHQLRQALQQELPHVAKEVLPLFQISAMFAKGSTQEHVSSTNIKRMEDVYRKHKDALDAFWQAHPELYEIPARAPHEEESHP